MTQGRTPPPGEMQPSGQSPQPGWIWVVTLGTAQAGLEGGGLAGGMGKGAGGQQGVMEPKSPTAFGSSWTKGSLGTQALDPIAVTQHAEGHFTSFSAFSS